MNREQHFLKKFIKNQSNKQYDGFANGNQAIN